MLETGEAIIKAEDVYVDDVEVAWLSFEEDTFSYSDLRLVEKTVTEREAAED